MSKSYEDLRVIVVADNASAEMGGEAILPLHYFRRLRQRGIEAWLVVHERSREELQRSHPELQDRISYVADTFLHQFLHRAGSALPARVASWSTGLGLYGLTQIEQRRIVRQLIEKHRASVVHQPTPVSPRVPSMLWNLGVPVVIGPLNGGMTFPEAFRSYQSLAERAFIRLGRSVAHVANQTLPGKREAAAVLVSNPRTRDALPRGCDRNVIELVENGVDLNLFSKDRLPPRTHGVRDPRARFVFVGRLVDWKAVDLLLEAVSLASERIELELSIVGDGPERAKLESQTRTLGLKDRVIFHGFVPQHECPPLLRQADALVLPSIYECGGAVVLEAMAMGLPVIATRYGGPLDYLDGGAGLLVDPSSPKDFVAGLADAMVRLATSSSLREELSVRGRRRIEERYDWERKIDRIIGIYRDVQRGPAQSAGAEGAA